MYKAWLRRLYTEPNPYTGIPLKDDPAVAIIQLQNEDSLLFYTESQIQGKPRDQLVKMFGDFLKKKYGSLETGSPTLHELRIRLGPARRGQRRAGNGRLAADVVLYPGRP